VDILLQKAIIHLLQRVKDLSIKDPRSIQATAIKLQEEAGELATEILIDTNESTKQPGKDGVPGECVDTILVAASMFFKNGNSINDLANLCDTKMQKWAADIDDRLRMNEEK